MGIRSFFSLVLKDFTIMSRSKISLFLILIAPLLIILLAGTAFNSSSLSGVTLGTYSEGYTELTEDILLSFEEQGFTVNRLGSADECIRNVKLGDVQICVVFPNDLSAEGSSNDVSFYRLNVTNHKNTCECIDDSEHGLQTHVVK